jgi:hypothetical protein
VFDCQHLHLLLPAPNQHLPSACGSAELSSSLFCASNLILTLILPHPPLQEQYSEEQFEVACTTPLQTVAPGPVSVMLSPAAKRKTASEFIQATTGVFVQFSSDQLFRGALKDGVLLCRMANTVWHGAVAQVSCR